MKPQEKVRERLGRRKGLEICEVTAGGIAEAVGIEVGDRIASINGREVEDVIDFRFLASEEHLVLELSKESGEVWEVDIDKEPDEDLGVDFDPMKIRQCPNKCFFCFVDQNPEGQRRQLYIRDEDYRFSFLFGNYITLTNLTKRDKARIFEQRLSPLYISVHTTDPELRRFMLGNPKARPILGEIQEMVDHGITLHTQVVLCPGVNDDRYLVQSIEDLARFYPAVGSLAIVPVGTTGHRDGLYPIREIGREDAREMIAWLRGWQDQLRERLGYPFVFPSDEFFIKADLPFPPLEAYEDLPQLENGVGMVPLFVSEMEAGVESLPERLSSDRIFTLITGASFSEYLEKVLSGIRIKGLTLRPVAIRNDFFGHPTTVTGLLTGGDIIAQLRGRTLGEALVIPDVTLNEQGRFLDDTTPLDVQTALGVKTLTVAPTAGGLLDLLKTLA